MKPFKYNGGLQINPSLLSPARVTTNFQVTQDRGVAPRHLQGCESILEIKETMRLLGDLDREKVLSECGRSYWRPTGLSECGNLANPPLRPYLAVGE
jgi:hypothetical protein